MPTMTQLDRRWTDEWGFWEDRRDRGKEAQD